MQQKINWHQLLSGKKHQQQAPDKKCMWLILQLIHTGSFPMAPDVWVRICNWTITGPASSLISANSLMDTGEKSQREQGRFKLLIGATNPDLNLNCRLLSEPGALPFTVIIRCAWIIKHGTSSSLNLHTPKFNFQHFLCSSWPKKIFFPLSSERYSMSQHIWLLERPLSTQNFSSSYQRQNQRERLQCDSEAKHWVTIIKTFF